MYAKPRHITWKDVNQIHRLNLQANDAVMYTPKADGHLTIVTFTKNEIVLESPLTIYRELIKVPKNIAGIFLQNVQLYCERIDSLTFCFFDIKLSENYPKRHAILSQIISELTSVNDMQVELVVKPYQTTYSAKLSEPLTVSNNTYVTDGIILYYDDKHTENAIKLKWSDCLTADLWCNLLDKSLSTEDGCPVGYMLVPNEKKSEVNHRNRRAKNFAIVEVIRYQSFFNFRQFRDDRTKANTYCEIQQMQQIPPDILHHSHSMYFLRHRFRVNQNTLLNYEYNCFKCEILHKIFRQYKNEITWLDIGCGNATDIYNALSMINVKFKTIHLSDADGTKIKKINQKLKNSFVSQLANIKTYHMDVNSVHAYYQIPKHSIDVCTLFLSCKNFDTVFFRNISRWLKPKGQITIVFFEDTLIPPNGIYCTQNDFGIKLHSETHLSVYRRGQAHWTLEQRLNHKKISSLFQKNGWKTTMRMIPSLWLEKDTNIPDMIMAMVLKRNLSKPRKLQKILNSDVTCDILSYCERDDLASLNVILDIQKDVWRHFETAKRPKHSYFLSDYYDSGYSS